MTGVLIRRGEDTQMHGKSSVKMEAEIGMKQDCKLRNTKDCQRSPEDGTGKQRFFPRAFRRSMTLWTP